MKKSKKLPGFESYNITIETQEEHDFLAGLLDGSKQTEKEDCDNYDNSLNQKFYDLITD